MLPERFPRGIIFPVVLVFVAQWSLAGTAGTSNILAPPFDIAIAFGSALRDGEMLTATVQTLGCAFAGLLIGSVIGLSLGILLGLFPFFDASMRIIIDVVRPIPAITLIPIGLLVFSFGYALEIAIVAFATIWPTLILCRSAVADVSPQLKEVAKVLGLSFHRTVIDILLPAAFPRILVALRLSLGVALVVAVTVEITSNTIGIGHGMFNASRTLNPALSLAYLVWIGLLGWSINLAVAALEARCRSGPREAGPTP